MDKFDTAAWKLLAELLEMAGREFGNHGCNDFELGNTPEHRELMNRVVRWNSQFPDEWDLHISKDGAKIYTQDYLLMGYFEHLAKEMAGIE